MIKRINLEVIDICNLKCKMCNIWQNKEKNILKIEDIENIFNSKYINKETDITITWWEPFLHTEIENIINKIYDLWFKISTISTNWTIYEKLYNLLKKFEKKEIKLPNIHISIDWDEKTHDEQRWINWSFKKSIETIIKLKKEFKNINIKIKYTVTKDNINLIDYVNNLSKKLWVLVWFKIVENDENYTNKISKTELLDENEKIIIYQKLKNINIYNEKYLENLIYYIKNNKLNFQCNIIKDNLFIKANWDVFSCIKFQKLWNIKTEKIDKIIWNKIHNEIINMIEKNNCNKCFSPHWSYKTII